MSASSQSPTPAHEHNRRAWDARVRHGKSFTKPAEDVDYEDPLGAVDGPGWLQGNIRGKTLLCLAAGGGRQGPLYAAAGAIVTVVDISPAMLEIDRQIAEQRNYRSRRWKLPWTIWRFLIMPASTLSSIP